MKVEEGPPFRSQATRLLLFRAQSRTPVCQTSIITNRRLSTRLSLHGNETSLDWLLATLLLYLDLTTSADYRGHI